MKGARKVVSLARKALSAPPRAVAREAGRRAWGASTRWASRQRDRVLPTYSGVRRGPGGLGPSLARILPAPASTWDGSGGDALAGACLRYVEHRFDLLGSGWVQVRYGRRYRGTEGHAFAPGPQVAADEGGAWLAGRVNPANLARARQAWGLVSRGYRPIDWHVDFKSGFRWEPTTWYRDITYGQVPGADVKVPWELARAQHLPRLALAYGAAVAGDRRFLPAERYLTEVKDQVLDFIATNPPRYGVNWSCTMDVAIRVANWLVAYDLLRAYGAPADPAFEAVLVASVHDHARFIAANLEWHPVFRSNHYLADICGLAFASAYLANGGRPPSSARRWLALAARELVAETELQFYPDGGNKEASTCYHRLSAEMVVYTTALLASVGALTPPQYQGQLERVRRMLGFSAWATRHDGQVAQVGDNDSGRFLAVAPLPARVTVAEAKARWANLEGYDELPDDDVHWAQDSLAHAHLLVAGQALLDGPERGSLGRALSAEVAWAASGASGQEATQACRALWRGAPVPIGARPGASSGGLSVDELEAAGSHSTLRWRLVPGGGGLLDGLEAVAFPDFGLFVLRSRRLYLAIRCGPVGQAGGGGHSHNDQLGLEVELDGRPWSRDPGSYLYTPVPEARNAYRSAQAHLVPHMDGAEPGDLSAGLFLLPERARARCLWFGPEGFAGAHWGYGPPTVREVRLADQYVAVSDAVPRLAGPHGPAVRPRAEAVVTSPAGLQRLVPAPVPFSPGYGAKEHPGG